MEWKTARWMDRGLGGPEVGGGCGMRSRTRRSHRAVGTDAWVWCLVHHTSAPVWPPDDIYLTSLELRNSVDFTGRWGVASPRATSTTSTTTKPFVDSPEIGRLPRLSYANATAAQPGGGARIRAGDRPPPGGPCADDGQGDP